MSLPKWFKVALRLGFIRGLLVFSFTSLSAQKYDTVKLGFLIQESGKTSAAKGASLAVKQINKKNGIAGRPVKLIVRGMEGPWGTGSKQAVSLIFDDNVWALLGSHDGRNAHLVEQAATKSITVFVSAWSSDPTLSKAYVPWFLNCMPNDKQQAEALVADIYRKHQYSNVVTIADDSYDSNQSLKNFLRLLQPKVHKQPKQLQYEGRNRNHLLYEKIKEINPECIVLFCRPIAAYEIVRYLEEKQFSKALYGTLSILDENELTLPQLEIFSQILHVPSALPGGPAYQLFKQQYIKEYGRAPGVVSAYAFDATNILMEAIRMAGSRDREKIQEALYHIAYEGVTGLVSFGDLGIRRWNPSVTVVKIF